MLSEEIILSRRDSPQSFETDSEFSFSLYSSCLACDENQITLSRAQTFEDNYLQPEAQLSYHERLSSIRDMLKKETYNISPLRKRYHEILVDSFEFERSTGQEVALIPRWLHCQVNNLISQISNKP